MDVRMVSNPPLPLPRASEPREQAPVTAGNGSRKEIPFIFAEQKSVSEQVREEVMMNLQEVQNFLYMLIGSRLRVESSHDSIGSSVNTTV